MPVPLPCVLLLLIGPPAAGKSSFARAMVDAGLVAPEAVVSCDAIREALFGPDTSSDSADPVVFARMDDLVRRRLRAGLPVVLDATNVTSQARLRMIKWAKAARRPVWAATFRVDAQTALDQNATREKVLPEAAVLEYAHRMQANSSPAQLVAEGIDQIIDVPGRTDNTSPAQAIRLVFTAGTTTSTE